MQSPPYLIAIETYGSQRVRAPASGAMVSAYKIGYSTIGRAVLLALYGSRALDVTSKHASYHYVSLEGDVSAHSGYLLMTLTENEFERVKQITRMHPSRRTGIFWWHEKQWWHFPHAGDTEFSPSASRTGPNIDPTRYRAVSPSSGEKVNTVEGIRAEYSQRSPHEPGWWWLTGDTYPHRDLLKRHGCRWSKKRSAWYFTGATLPAAVQTLASQPGLSGAPETRPATQNIDAPHSDAEVERRGDVSPAPVVRASSPVMTSALPQQHRFALGQTVYLATSLRVTPTLKLKMDTPGTIIHRYEHKKTPDFHHKWAYGVDFGEHGIHTLFQDSLDNVPQNLPGIERHETVMVMFGTSAEQGILAEIERRQRIPQDYTALDEEAAQPRDVSTTALDEHPLDPHASPSLSPDVSSQAPAIRILAPAVLPSNGDSLDAVQGAILQAKQQPLQPVKATGLPSSNTRHTIMQAYCGELTGSITGQVYAYGFAVHQQVLLYLNLGGPRMAVEAIRAKLSKGETVSLVPPDAPAIELSAGETEGQVNTGMYAAYIQTLPEARFTSAILVHEWLMRPNYLGKSTTGLFRTSDGQAMAKLLHHIRQLVNVPLFDQWASYLYQAGQTAGLVRKPSPTGGGIDLLIVELDIDAWARLITGGLANGVIALPQMAVK